MAKKKTNCARKTIRIKTKRGRVITFQGRAGGSDACGAAKGAGVRKRAVALAAGRRKFSPLFAGAARDCHQKSRAKRNACVRQHMKSQIALDKVGTF